MRQSGFMKLALLLLATGVMIGYQACSPNSFSKNGSSSPEQASLDTPAAADDDGKDQGTVNNGGTTTDNPKPVIDVEMSTFEAEDVQSAEMCVSEIRLYPVGALLRTSNSGKGSVATSVFDTQAYLEQLYASMGLNFGSNAAGAPAYLREVLNNLKVMALPSGTQLQKIGLPAGQYQQVDLQLSSSCGNSLMLQNSAGTIPVRNGVIMRFVGLLNVSAVDPRLTLNLSPLMKELSRARDADDVEDILEDAFGGL